MRKSSFGIAGKSTQQSQATGAGLRSVKRAFFGKKLDKDHSGAALRREKLELVAFELGLLLFGSAGYDAEGFLAVSNAGEPRLWIGRGQDTSMSVELDGDVGHYILREYGRADSCLLATNSEERLIDHVLGQLARDDSDLAPKTADMAIDVLVGQSMESVERRFILRTIRHFRGDFERAARILRVPVPELHARMRSYLSSFYHPSTRREREQ